MDGNRLNNPWGNLPDDAEENELHLQQVNSSNQAEVKVPKPPPISVYNINIIKLKENISNIKEIQSEIYFKILYDSVQVTTQNFHDYQIVIKQLNNNNAEYTTDPLKGDRNVKICLFGLPELDTAEIKNELSRYNVKPSDIKVITPKNNYAGGARIYLLFFKQMA